MSRANGFMIPLDHTDWTNNGDRTNWCSSQVWWTNQNIALKGSSLGPTDAKVGEPVTITVGIQGVVGPEGDTELAVIQNVKAWACYPSPTAGRTSASLVLPSMQSTNPSFSGNLPVFGSNPVFNPGDYQDSSQGFYSLVALGGTWTPSTEDLVPPNENTHCCIVAACAGLAQAEESGGLYTGNPVGEAVPTNSDLASRIDICSSPYQGQTNIAIVPLSAHGMRVPGGLAHEFGFLAAASDATGVTSPALQVAPIRLKTEVDPFLLRLLQSGPYRDLPWKRALSGLKRLRLVRNPHECRGFLRTLIVGAEQIVEETIESAEHPFREGSRLRLRLPPRGVQPLVVQIELDASLSPGSIFEFDITQMEADGKHGGIRIVAIIVP